MKFTHKDSEFEGTTEEFHNFSRNNGMDLSQYFIQPKPISNAYVLLPILLWILFILVVTLAELDSDYKKALGLLLSGCSAWIGIIVKKRFEMETVLFTIILVIISLTASGLIPIEKLLEYISKLK